MIMTNFSVWDVSMVLTWISSVSFDFSCLSVSMSFSRIPRMFASLRISCWIYKLEIALLVFKHASAPELTQIKVFKMFRYSNTFLPTQNIQHFKMCKTSFGPAKKSRRQIMTPKCCHCGPDPDIGVKRCIGPWDYFYFSFIRMKALDISYLPQLVLNPLF